MNTQNILNFYASNLSLKLDSSEFYDYELNSNLHDFDYDLLDLTTPIEYGTLIIDSFCITGQTFNNIKPWVIPIGVNYQSDLCDFTVRERTEYGWTLNMVFNKNGSGFTDNNTFYYWGIQNETEEGIFADNNLSFSFTNDGEILWKSYRYSGYCQTESGYTESFYVSSGKTPTLCTNGISNDFNISIVFQRNFYLENCEVQNDGGLNDLIVSTDTTTQLNDWLTGVTLNLVQTEELNKKWFNERDYRLGTLRIFLNGNQIYKVNDWEEILPSKRGSENDIVQIFGGGSDGYLSLHTGNTNFDILQVKYFEEPLQPLNVKHHYLTEIKPIYNITECGTDCLDTVYSFVVNGILTENEDNLITENNNMIIF